MTGEPLSGIQAPEPLAAPLSPLARPGRTVDEAAGTVAVSIATHITAPAIAERSTLEAADGETDRSVGIPLMEVAAASVPAVKGSPSTPRGVHEVSSLAATTAREALAAALSRVAQLQLRCCYTEAEAGPTAVESACPGPPMSARVTPSERTAEGAEPVDAPVFPAAVHQTLHAGVAACVALVEPEAPGVVAATVRAQDAAVDAAASAGGASGSADADRRKTKPTAKRRKAGQAAAARVTPGLHISNEMTLAQVLVLAARVGLESPASITARSGMHNPGPVAGIAPSSDHSTSAQPPRSPAPAAAAATTTTSAPAQAVSQGPTQSTAQTTAQATAQGATCTDAARHAPPPVDATAASNQALSRPFKSELVEAQRLVAAESLSRQADNGWRLEGAQRAAECALMGAAEVDSRELAAVRSWEKTLSLPRERAGLTAEDLAAVSQYAPAWAAESAARLEAQERALMDVENDLREWEEVAEWLHRAERIARGEQQRLVVELFTVLDNAMRPSIWARPVRLVDHPCAPVSACPGPLGRLQIRPDRIFGADVLRAAAPSSLVLRIAAGAVTTDVQARRVAFDGALEFGPETASRLDVGRLINSGARQGVQFSLVADGSVVGTACYDLASLQRGSLETVRATLSLSRGTGADAIARHVMAGLRKAQTDVLPQRARDYLEILRNGGARSRIASELAEVKQLQLAFAQQAREAAAQGLASPDLRVLESSVTEARRKNRAALRVETEPERILEGAPDAVVLTLSIAAFGGEGRPPLSPKGVGGGGAGGNGGGGGAAAGAVAPLGAGSLPILAPGSPSLSPRPFSPKTPTPGDGRGWRAAPFTPVSPAFARGALASLKVAAASPKAALSLLTPTALLRKELVGEAWLRGERVAEFAQLRLAAAPAALAFAVPCSDAPEALRVVISAGGGRPPRCEAILVMTLRGAGSSRLRVALDAATFVDVIAEWTPELTEEHRSELAASEARRAAARDLAHRASCAAKVQALGRRHIARRRVLHEMALRFGTATSSPPWRVHVDPISGCCYYASPDERSVRWWQPEASELGKAARAEAQAAAAISKRAGVARRRRLQQHLARALDSLCHESQLSARHRLALARLLVRGALSEAPDTGERAFPEPSARNLSRACGLLEEHERDAARRAEKLPLTALCAQGEAQFSLWNKMGVGEARRLALSVKLWRRALASSATLGEWEEEAIVSCTQALVAAGHLREARDALTSYCTFYRTVGSPGRAQALAETMAALELSSGRHSRAAAEVITLLDSETLETHAHRMHEEDYLFSLARAMDGVCSKDAEREAEAHDAQEASAAAATAAGQDASGLAREQRREQRVRRARAELNAERREDARKSALDAFNKGVNRRASSLAAAPEAGPARHADVEAFWADAKVWLTFAQRAYARRAFLIAAELYQCAEEMGATLNPGMLGELAQAARLSGAPAVSERAAQRRWQGALEEQERLEAIRRDLAQRRAPVEQLARLRAAEVLLREETAQARRFLEVFTLYGWAARRAHAVVAAVASGRLARQRRVGGLLLAGWHDAARRSHTERVAAASTVQRLARGHSARKRAHAQRKLRVAVEVLRGRVLANTRRRALAGSWDFWAATARQLRRLRVMLKQRRQLAESLALRAWRDAAYAKRRTREALVQRARRILTRGLRARRAARLAAEQAERTARLAAEQAEHTARLAAEQAERAARLAAEEAERVARLAAEEAERAARLIAERAERAERAARLHAAVALQRWMRRERARHARRLEARMRVQVPAAKKLQQWWRTRDERAAMARRLRVRQLRGPYVRFFRRTIREQAASRVITRAIRAYARALRDERLVKSGAIALRHAQRRRERVESGAAFARLQRRVRARVAGPIASRRKAAATRIQAAERGRQCRKLTRALFMANLKRRALLFLSPTNKSARKTNKRTGKRSKASSPARGPELQQDDSDDEQPSSRRRVRLPKISPAFSAAIIGAPRVQALYVLPMVPAKRGPRQEAGRPADLC